MPSMFAASCRCHLLPSPGVYTVPEVVVTGFLKDGSCLPRPIVKRLAKIKSLVLNPVAVHALNEPDIDAQVVVASDLP